MEDAYIDFSKLESGNNSIINDSCENIYNNKSEYLKLIQRKCLWKCTNKEECSEQIFQDILTDNLRYKTEIEAPPAYIKKVAPQKAVRHIASCLTCNQSFTEDDIDFEPAFANWLGKYPQTEQIYTYFKMLSDFKNYTSPENFLVFKLGFVFEFSDPEIYESVSQHTLPKNLSNELQKELLNELEKFGHQTITFAALKQRKSRTKIEFIMFCNEFYPELFSKIESLLKDSNRKFGQTLYEKVKQMLSKKTLLGDSV